MIRNQSTRMRFLAILAAILTPSSAFAAPHDVALAKAACVDMLESEIIVPGDHPLPDRRIGYVMGFPGQQSQTAVDIYVRRPGDAVQIRPRYTVYSNYADIRTVCGYDRKGRLYARLDRSPQIPVRTW